ncbi:MAG: hypothetical protein ACKODH_15420 [Limisphaerales bacterium]
MKPGAGLAEAKEAVERLEAGLRAQHPETFTAPAQKSGCTAVLAVLAVLVIVLVWSRF